MYPHVLLSDFRNSEVITQGGDLIISPTLHQIHSIFRLSVGEEVIASVGEVVVGFRVHPAAALVLNRVVFLQVMTITMSTMLLLMITIIPCWFMVE